MISPGRSGTAYLYRAFSSSFPTKGSLYHEALHVAESRPRDFFRPYEPDVQEAIRAQDPIARCVERWARELEDGPVVEFGWTAAHLAPFLADMFQDRFQVVLLHRHPVVQAGSRATMGNYSDGYESHAHKISPDDPRTLYPTFGDRWTSMSPFEKCLYWWLEYTGMGLEFLRRRPEIASNVVASSELFDSSSTVLSGLTAFLGFRSGQVEAPEGRVNTIARSRVERWPLGAEWKKHRRHTEVHSLADELGYEFDEGELEEAMQRYQYDRGVGPLLRHHLRYWRIKAVLGAMLRRLPLGGDELAEMAGACERRVRRWLTRVM